MHRHCQDYVVVFTKWQRSQQQPRKVTSQAFYFAVLKKLYQFLKSAAIAAKGISRIEASLGSPARPAPASVVERAGVHKRCPAGRTKEFHLEWFSKLKAGGADRNSRYIVERGFAEAAIIRKERIKQCRNALR